MDSEDDSRGVEPGLVSMIVSEAFVFRDGMITLCTWFHHPTQSWSSLFVFVFFVFFSWCVFLCGRFVFKKPINFNGLVDGHPLRQIYGPAHEAA